jgi:hypothetical protein
MDHGRDGRGPGKEFGAKASRFGAEGSTCREEETRHEEEAARAP